jgi:hypothetical protein
MKPCPNCKTIGTLYVKGEELTCKKCGEKFPLPSLGERIKKTNKNVCLFLQILLSLGFGGSAAGIGMAYESFIIGLALFTSAIVSVMLVVLLEKVIEGIAQMVDDTRENKEINAKSLETFTADNAAQQPYDYSGQ